MKVSLAVIADYANLSQEGKLNILGIFDRVHVRAFPGGLPQAFLVVRLVAALEELGTQHRLRFRLTDPDGRHLSELSIELAVPHEGFAETRAIDLILPAAPMLIFEREGPHELAVAIDEADQHRIKLTVSRLAAPTG